METFAEGLATRTAFELPQRILARVARRLRPRRRRGDPRAQALMIETTRNLVEAAGARRSRPRCECVIS
jgi:hypothetical protein